MVKAIFSTVAELAGVALVAVGLWMLAPWLGVTVAGVGLTLIGVALDPPRRRGGERE